MLARIEGSLGAVAQSKLGEDVGHMVFDGALSDEKRLANLAVGRAPGNQLQDVAFALGQFFDVGHCC